MPIRLVEAEHEATRDPVAVHQPLEFAVLAAEPVDVGAEVDMSVEDLGVGGKLVAERLVVFRDERLGSGELLVHAAESTHGPVQRHRPRQR
jgi:hypothetical protein